MTDMSESSSPARRHGRATRVALRTLRQVPKVLGETGNGDPIVEVRSVRLLLHADASHFNRLVACSKCGVEAAGAPVLRPGDLKQTPHPIICRICVSAAGTMYDTKSDLAPPAARPSERSLADDDGHERKPATTERLAALEQRIADLADLLGGRLTVAEASVDERLEVSRAEVATLSAGAGEMARAEQRVEDKLNAVIERLGGLLTSTMVGLTRSSAGWTRRSRA
jgi:hypothetical protein